MKIYRTIKQARSAAALDAGYDRWNYRRITIADLWEAGYVVNHREWRRRRDEERQEQEKMSAEPSHSFSCDNGHRWSATNEADRAAGHKCPTCGEYWQ